MKEKSVLRRLIPWLIALVLIALLVIFVGIPLYAPQKAEAVDPPEISYYEDGKQTLSMENDKLLFEMDAETTQFTLTEKASGRVWRSTPENAASDPVAGAKNKNVLQSTMIVTYSSSSGTIDFNNYEYSIQNGTYKVSQDADGAVRVVYSVGQIEKIYFIPNVITVERFTAFTKAMGKDARKVTNNYTLYKPDKVATADNKDELLSMYPELANQELYVLKADTKENTKKSMATYFENAGYTQEDYELDEQLRAGAYENTSPVFNVTVIYRLEDGDFVVEVPYQEIRYRAEYPITAVTVLPMFGAAGKDEEGFMLVPEGGGAIIRYNNGKLSQNSYYANLYGWDYGSERREVVSETRCDFPVFGMTKQGGSFICILEGAPSYAGIQADIAMRLNSYNYINAKYTVLHSDRYNVSAKTAQLVYMFEKELPDDTIRQRYRFLDSDSYSDMAVAYGDYLAQTYPQLKEKEAGSDMPVSVELIGAIDKIVVKAGLPMDSIVPLTTFKQAENLIQQLSDSGVRNLDVRFTGWSNGGVSQKVLSRVNILGQLGGVRDMDSLIQKAKALNTPLYFDGINCFAYRSGLFNGFIPARDSARYTTRELIEIYPYSMITYQPMKARKPFYLVQPSYAKAKATSLINALKARQAYGIAFRDIGSLLSGDYNTRANVTRQESLKMNLDTLQEAKNAGQAVMVKTGFDYILPYADIITDMDLTGINYSLLDAQVPFYQMAIHGLVDYTGKSINLADDWQTELLRCAEYGAGLNFTFMQESGKELQETNYTAYYGAAYDAWAGEAEEIITRYQKDMAGLNGIRMTGHEEINEDVSLTKYADGRQVYVNYGYEPYQAAGVEVPARSYLVTGGNAQ